MWLCSSWASLQHCVCTSRCTRLAAGHVCSVNTRKLHLKCPGGCVMVHVLACVVAVLWLWLLGHLQENTACLLLRLQCQSGEKEPVCHSRGFSSFLPAPLLAPHPPRVQRTVRTVRRTRSPSCCADTVQVRGTFPSGTAASAWALPCWHRHGQCSEVCAVGEETNRKHQKQCRDGAEGSQQWLWFQFSSVQSLSRV